MSSPRLKGVALSMRVDGTDHWADVTSIVMDGEDFEYRRDDGRGITGVESLRVAWWFDVEAIQSTHPESFWSFLYQHCGRPVPFDYAPHGNYDEPTDTEPHFTGILNVPGPPALGGEAGRDVEQTFSTRLHIVGDPLRVPELIT